MHPMTFRILFPIEKHSDAEDVKRSRQPDAVLTGLLGVEGSAIGYFGAPMLAERAQKRAALLEAERLLAGSAIKARFPNVVVFPGAKNPMFDPPVGKAERILARLSRLESRTGRLGLATLGGLGLGGLGVALTNQNSRKQAERV